MAGYWSNDGEGTRPDSRWGVLDEKNTYVFLVVTVDKILLCLYGPDWEIIENTYYFNIWYYVDNIKESENAKKKQL